MSVLAALMVTVLGVATAQEELDRFYPDGTPLERYAVVVDSQGVKVRHGASIRFHANGRKAAAGGYRMGERQGAWKFYHPDGKPQGSGRFQRGVRTGRWNFWTEDGKLDPGPSGVYVIDESDLARGARLYGQKQARWRFFRKDGTLAVEGHYRFDLPEGVFRIFHPDGTLDLDFVSGEYRNAQRVGPLPMGEDRQDAPRVESLASCLKALPPAGLDEEVLSAIESALEDWIRYEEGSDERTAGLIQHGAALMPALLRRLAGTDLTRREELRTASRLVRGLLAPLHNGWSFEWRDGVSEADQAVNRLSILRWHALFEWTREQPAFLSLMLPLAGRPDGPRAEPNPLFEARPEMLLPIRKDLFSWSLGSVPTLRGRRGAERAVDRALGWLVRHQESEGHWSAVAFSKSCAEIRCDGNGDADRNVDVTALALLALLGDPDRSRQLAHADSIRRTVGWLSASQSSQTGGWSLPYTLRDPVSGEQYQALSAYSMHGSALASLALAEATALYGLEGALCRASRRAVDFGQRSRNPYKAWGYSFPPDGNNVMSVTGWMTMAQITASRAGLQVNPQFLDGVRLYLDEMTDPHTSRTGNRSQGGYTLREAGLGARWPEQQAEATTALALTCRLLIGESPTDSQALKGGTDLLLRRLPHWGELEGTIDYRYWFFGTQSLAMMGGQAWELWSPRVL